MFNFGLIHGIVILLMMIIIIRNTNQFDKIQFDKGSDEYTEKIWTCLPWFCSMPLNSLVNLFYTILGFYWLKKNHLKSEHLHVFSWMIIIYSGIQYNRILKQDKMSCLLDQWFTLQLASWVLIWILNLKTNDEKWLRIRTFSMETVSFLSYPIFTFLHPKGFEIIFGFHLILIFICTIRYELHLQQQKNSFDRLSLMCLSSLSCLGFILFDLFEFRLAHWYPSIFTICSGHFLSRFCDVLQIHLVIKLFNSFESFEFNKKSN